MNKIIKPLTQKVYTSIKYYVSEAKRQYIPSQSDLFIVEFPKSGVTWLNTILANIELTIFNESDGSRYKKTVVFGNLESFISDIHVGYPCEYRSLIFGGRLIKSHSKATREMHRLVYLYRHPLNVMKSYYRMQKGYNLIPNELSFIDFVHESKMGIDAWKEHINSWIFSSSPSQRICFLSYECLKDKTHGCIQNI
ncbi:MAG: sulfotransferase domain-containing protein, partial [Cyanothece sp. SIO2G6]|nr:sulfotransferase domain-containing protein [Cyanothece sp. SIO2G6]